MVFHRQLIQGGDIIDLALQSGLRDEFDMQIHAAAARDLKHRIGAALIDDEHAPAHTSCQVVGRDVVSGRIRNFRIGADTVHQMMQPVLAELLQATLDACDCLPAALADSLHRNGLRLVGGGAALTHLQALITEYTGLPISIADRPLTATVRGAATMLDQAIDTRRQAGSDLQKMVG
jgi:rod shape-determining protein MreB